MISRSRHIPRINPRTRFLGKTSERLLLWLVDGEMIRDHIFVDFVAGGNGGRYPDFIPRNEIWVEKNLTPRDRDATILHEIVERRLMLFKNLSYSKAHDQALIVEQHFRVTFPRA